MDILFVSVEDINGGAARAAYRIYKSLQNSGIKCKMLVQNKTSDDFTVIGPETIFRKAFGRIRPLLDSIPVKKYKNRSQTAFSTSYFPFSDVSKKINALNPDIVHLHYCDTMFRIEDLKRIKAPIVYHLHDMWPFTGGCHYD